MPKSYEQIHAGLLYFNGPANTFLCCCGAQAQSWAYQHNGGAELVSSNGHRYTEDLSCYQPMCRSCHQRLDKHPEILGAEKFQRLQVTASANLAFGRTRITREHRVQASFTRQTRDGYAEAQIKAGEAAAALRRKCAECPATLAPGPLGTHQRYSGHQGWVEP